MIPTSIGALAILLLAIAPGYVTLTAWGRARTWGGHGGDFRTLLQSVVLSAIVAALMMPVTMWWILPIRTSWEMFPNRLAIWSVLTIIVVPVLLGTAGGRLYDALFDLAEDRSRGWREKLDKVVGPQVPPTAWDLAFLREVTPKSGFLIVGFDDGEVLAGAFSTGSEVLTSPHTQGVYLEREWIVGEDGTPEDEVAKTAGLLIPTLANVKFVRFLSSEEEKDEEGASDESK